MLASASALVSSPSLLTDPFLQNPTPDSVHVVWFTEFAGESHTVEYGTNLKYRVQCQTTKLSRMQQEGEPPQERSIYRHEATLTPLVPGERTPYRVVSKFSKTEVVASEIFSCEPTPLPGRSLKILFTSDHQVKPLVAANLQKVKELFPNIDAVFFAGDCVNHADHAAEWFDDPSGGGFFPCLQGKAHRQMGSVVYKGGALLQYAPSFYAIGNHEVMGRCNPAHSLDEQFNDPYPKEKAEEQYQVLFPTLNDPSHRAKWVKEHSFNTDSYEQIFTLPTSSSGGKKYYATTFGDIRLVVLYATRIWRPAPLDKRGKYSEKREDLDHPEKWGYGDFIFEPIDKESPQYRWLEEELKSEPFQQAKYKIVMLHNPLHSLGENSIPPYTNPIQKIENDRISYHYPKEHDVLIRDLEPLLTTYGVHLVLCGHTHVWNRFQSPEGVHHLETSNVGNSYGAYLSEKRTLLPGKEDNDYSSTGDPNGLPPFVPTLAPLSDVHGLPEPYLSSNDITAFSIFSTDTGAVDSYYFDTRKPESPVVHFDKFFILENQYAVHAAPSLTTVQKHAQEKGLPRLLVVDIDNTLIESARQIGLDPSVNGFLRKKFPQTSEEVIRAIQAAVPWKMCEDNTAQVIRFFQDKKVQVIGVTKRSLFIKEKVDEQLKTNGIDLEISSLANGPLKVGKNLYYKGVLYADSDKGSALKAFLEKLGWKWQGQKIYAVEDRKSHLKDVQKQFTHEAEVVAFEYQIKQHVDNDILEKQLADFLAGKEIQEDDSYKPARPTKVARVEHAP